MDHLYSFILDGPSLLDRPSGPLGALMEVDKMSSLTGYDLDAT